MPKLAEYLTILAMITATVVYAENQYAKTADIPVIIVSVIQPKESGPEWGAGDHISKPFAIEKLMDNIRRTLESAKREKLAPVSVAH